jgi:hypothetical protein
MPVDFEDLLRPPRPELEGAELRETQAVIQAALAKRPHFPS